MYRFGLATVCVLVSVAYTSAAVVLEYDFSNGSATIDTLGVTIESFGLENEIGGQDFVGTADFSDLPAGTTVSNNLTIVWSGVLNDNTFNGVANLGNVFPTGFSEQDLSDFLTDNSGYVEDNGTMTLPFMISVVPEPSAFALLAFVACLALLLPRAKYVWRYVRN